MRSGQSSARILACTTGVFGTLIGVFEATRIRVYLQRENKKEIIRVITIIKRRRRRR